jgi:hypothetical protein
MTIGDVITKLQSLYKPDAPVQFEIVLGTGAIKDHVSARLDEIVMYGKNCCVRFTDCPPAIPL